ncbi:carboxyltransferase domain-containing protein [Geodermatophilus sp. URMC 62]|uniref:carboxyltransferase domain-containing protein n=1 Tax=Geodermatophilus sp. URMC 62 TaxID=3423414 RepID=UPI00406C399E
MAELVGRPQAEIVRRHTRSEWTVGFCGFAPGTCPATPQRCCGRATGSGSPTWDGHGERRDRPRHRAPPRLVHPRAWTTLTGRPYAVTDDEQPDRTPSRRRAARAG